MLMVAEDIFQEVEAATILLNGEVVRRAFKTLNCESHINLETTRTVDWNNVFPQFCCPYAELLAEYEKTKGIAISAHQRILDPLTTSEKRWQPVWLIRQSRFAYAAECDQKKDELRARLGLICPCPKCLSSVCVQSIWTGVPIERNDCARNK